MHENTFYTFGGITKYKYCMFIDQLGKYQVKDMNVYIDPLVDELIKLWDTIIMYELSRQIGKRNFGSMEYLHGQFMMPQG